VQATTRSPSQFGSTYLSNANAAGFGLALLLLFYFVLHTLLLASNRQPRAGGWDDSTTNFCEAEASGLLFIMFMILSLLSLLLSPVSSLLLLSYIA
jgi:hypothetical protein